MTVLAQRSLAGGEVASAIYGRVDLVKYQTGLKTCRNALVARHGGAFNRPGTGFVGEVKDSTKTVRLIPFVFNSDQTYVLEFGDLYMRVHRNGAQVTLTAQAITGITNANPAVVTYSGADTYANGDEVYISGVVGAMANFVNGRNFKVANVNAGANTFELKYMDNSTNVNSTAFGAYTSGGTVAEVFTLTTPYVEADLQDLRFVQSADVITIVHPNYAPRELARTAHTSWTLTTITFAPGIAAPASPSAAGGAGTGFDWIYKITAVKADSLEESLPSVSATLTNKAAPVAATPNVVTWTAVSGAQEYNVYRQKAIPTATTGDGIYGFIGTAAGTTFNDDGAVSPDFLDTPSIDRALFASSSNFPSAVTYFQQRLALANSDTDPERAWLSRTGFYKNFTIRSPIQDDDAVTFDIVGRQVNEIQHLVDLGTLLILTTGGAWTAEGDADGTLKPTSINLRQRGFNGANNLAPIIIGGNALYVQSRGNIVRDFGFDFQIDGYKGNDLTVFAPHLFEGYTLRDWSYQEIPHSIIWAVRSDGVLLGLTYLREHQIWGWHRHDFGTDTVEQVCVVPEGLEDAVYVVVKRTIAGLASLGGATRRYVERFKTRRVDDIRDSVFMDSSLSTDGRNTTAETMTLSGGTAWTSDETLTLTRSVGGFVAGDVGNQIFLTGSDGTVIRFTIDAFSSTTVVTGRAHKTVPVSMRAVATATWSRAVDDISGLWHLEGKDLAIFGDGFVEASPNNASYVVKTVANGSVTLSKPYAVIHAGLPYISDIETLNMELPQGETMADKNKLVTKVTLFVESTRGLWAGPKPPTDDDDDPLENLMEFKLRNTENYDEPVDLATGAISVNIKPEWNSNGRVFIRQVDPIPASVLTIAPGGNVPLRG